MVKDFIFYNLNFHSAFYLEHVGECNVISTQDEDFNVGVHSELEAWKIYD